MTIIVDTFMGLPARIEAEYIPEDKGSWECAPMGEHYELRSFTLNGSAEFVGTPVEAIFEDFVYQAVRDSLRDNTFYVDGGAA
jgi:hypothetical protein